MGEKNNQWWGWSLDKEISGSFSDYLGLMLGKPRIRLNNLKTSLRSPCLGLNPIIDSIILNQLIAQSKFSQIYFEMPVVWDIRSWNEKKNNKYSEPSL